MKLIDADELCKKINSSIKLALEWENEARENKDTHGVKCAIDTRRALLAMLSRVQEEPTIDAQPVKRGHWSECYRDCRCISVICSVCKNPTVIAHGCRDADEVTMDYVIERLPHCPKCCSDMEVM